MIRANPIACKFEFDMDAEAAIAYSYKNFFKLGIHIKKSDAMEDF